MYKIHTKDNLTELINIIVNNPAILNNPQNQTPLQVIAHDRDIINLTLEMDGELGKLTLYKNGNAKWEPYIEVDIEVED